MTDSVTVRPHWIQVIVELPGTDTVMRPDGKIRRGWGAVLHVAQRRNKAGTDVPLNDPPAGWLQTAMMAVWRVTAVEPRDQTWELDQPRYRVYIHDTAGASD